MVNQTTSRKCYFSQLIVFVALFCLFLPTGASFASSDAIPFKDAPTVVERIFGEVFGKKITNTESVYWKERARADKKTETELKGAMYFQKAKGLTMPKSGVTANKPASTSQSSGLVAGVSSASPLLLLNNAYIVANDGTYLGLITSNRFDSKSILNTYGTYGSKYSSKSIFNPYGTYGSKYSSQSPFNQYAFSPPRIYSSYGTFLGYLTLNSFKAGAINPYSLIGYLQSH